MRLLARDAVPVKEYFDDSYYYAIGEVTNAEFLEFDDIMWGVDRETAWHTQDHIHIFEDDEE